MPGHQVRSYLPVMSEPHVPAGSWDDAGQYEIRVQGRLDARWAAWFDGLTLTAGSDGSTCIHGVVIDQSALHGLLQKVRDTGLPLVSVRRVHTPDPR